MVCDSLLLVWCGAEFLKGRMGFHVNQLKSELPHETSTHRVLLYDGPSDPLFCDAQKVWRRSGFGKCRASGSSNRTSRMDKGIKRKHRCAMFERQEHLENQRQAICAWIQRTGLGSGHTQNSLFQMKRTMMRYDCFCMLNRWTGDKRPRKERRRENKR